VPQSALSTALRRLGQRPYTRREISDYLTRRNYAAEEVSAALTRLIELGYLDDLEAARATVRYRELHPRGRLLVARELRHRGLDATTVELALLDYDERSLARELAKRLAAQGKSQEAVQRALINRGFRSASVLAATEDGSAEVDLS
jgi:regulatory protein